MMKKLLIRPFPWRSSTPIRLFSSPQEAEVPVKPSSSPPPPPAEEEEKKKVYVKPLYRQLSALGGAADGSVFKTMNNWIRQGNKSKAIELMKYVKDLRKYKRHKHALQLMDWMVKVRGMNMSHNNHAIRIDLISKVNGIESAEDYFSKLPDSAKKSQTYGALFNCYCAEKMVNKATSLYEKMKELNFASNTLAHNNLMSLYMKLEQHEKVPILLQYMKENNIVADNVTYCIVMKSFAAMNDIDSVERIMHEMEEDEKVTVQWSACSTLASIYISASDFVKAEMALKKLEGLIDNRDREPFHYLISLYAGTGNLEEVKRVWKSLKQIFVKCTNMSYLTMLQALNKLDDIEGLKECYEEWESIYETYDVKLTNVVLSCYLRNDVIEEAESLYARTKEKVGDLDFRTCDLFLDFYLMKNKMDLALEWLEIATNMVKVAEWKLDQEKVSLFLKHFEQERDVNGLEKFCKVTMKLNCLGTTEFELLKWIKEEEIKLKPKTEKLLDKVFASR